MREILPGIHHWTIEWPGIFPLESYWLKTPAGGILFDPIEGHGPEAAEIANDTLAVVLTNGWHERSAALFAQRTGAPIYLPAGHEGYFEALDEYETYAGANTLPGDLLAIATAGGKWSAGEHALLSPLHGGTLLVADCLGTTAKWTPWDMALGGHPHFHPHPAESLSHLLEYEFENLLPGHGDPIVGGARQALRELIESGTSTTPPPVLN
ncbi:MAG: hypothetical protein QF573_00630 [Chloroflexota bacterium]|nr:hypothetical protein [Chloroflexota bacterium]